MNVVYVTGNPGKADYFSKITGMDIKHHAADVDEVQSLDLEEIAIYKAKQAYAQLQSPLIVEDTSLSIDSLGGLPGPFIKWFEKTLGLDGICKLADQSPNRAAKAQNVHVFYDGGALKVFKSSLGGLISDKPKGATGFGFNPIFIPEGSSQTMAEMSEEDFIEAYLKIKPIMQLKEYLLKLDKK